MHLDSKPIPVALAGMVALAVAMGIGRFAFTPLLPMMLADGVVDLAGASWLASANYLGYLLGALLCTLQPWLWRRFPGLPALSSPALVRAGLAATCLLTLGMALQLPALWPLLRFAAGVASAIVFIFTSGWCLAQLAQRDATALGGLVYTGPGGGIVVSGLVAGAAGELAPVRGHRLAAVRPDGVRAQCPGLAGFQSRRGAHPARPVRWPRRRRQQPSGTAPKRRCSRWPMGWPDSATSSPPPSCR